MTSKASTKTCPFCAEQIHTDAKKCKYCHEILDEEMRKSKESAAAKRPFNPGVAAVLSFFIPGAGQIYRGQIMEGIFWLVFVIAGYAFFIFPGIILHLCCIVKAYGATKPKAVAPAVSQKRRLFGIKKWQEYPVLFVLGFLLPSIIVGMMNSNNGSDAPSDHPGIMFAFIFAPALLVPILWLFLRPYAVRQGWVSNDAV